MKYSGSLKKEEIEKAVQEYRTMGEAAASCLVDWRTFKRHATKYGLYKPAKPGPKRGFTLEDVFAGKYPHLQSIKLSRRLIEEKRKEYICESCGITEWNGKKITLELNHKNGIRTDHRLENLEFLCPNCHSQTGYI